MNQLYVKEMKDQKIMSAHNRLPVKTMNVTKKDYKLSVILVTSSHIEIKYL